MINKNFEKWATGYAGFDGGNPNGKIWLCGIEWGGHQTEDINDLIEDFKNVITEIPCGYSNHTKNLEFPYNYKFLKVMAAIKGLDFLLYGNNTNKIKNILKEFNDRERCFTRNSNYLKLNIFPLQFKEDNDELWTEPYIQATGFNTKEEYRLWCLTNGRLELFRKMTNQYNPSLIITVGAGYHYYKEAFGYKNIDNNDKLKNITLALKNGNGKVRMIVDIDHNRLFVNIPFLGRPLNSHKLMIETGEKIRSLINEYNISLDQ